MIKTAIKQFITYGAGSVAENALGFILLPLYLRFFAPSEYGVIAMLLIVVSLVTLFANVGVQSALFMLYYEADEIKRKRLVGTTCFWYLLGAVAGGVVLYTQAPWLSQTFFHTADFAYAFKLVAGYFFFSMLLTVPFAILRLEKKPRSYVGLSIAKVGIDFGLKFYFIAFLARGIGGYFEAGIIANAVALFCLLPFTMKYISFSINSSYLKRLLRLGFPFIFSTFAIWALNMSDRFILNYFHGPAEVGIYSLANTLASVFQVLLYAPLGLFWAPFFLSYASERSAEDTKRLFATAMKYFFLAASALLLAITLGAGDMLRIFHVQFGAQEGYLQAAMLVPLLTLGIFLHFMSDNFANPLFIVKRSKFFAIGGGIAAAVNIGLNFLFIPRFGALGAALTTIIAYAVHLALFYRWSMRLYPVDYHLRKLVPRGLLFLGAAFIIGWNIEISHPWSSLFAKEIAGIAAFGLLIWFVSDIMSKEEQHSLLSYLPKKGLGLITRLLYR